MYAVYSLTDPRDNRVFYVGMTADMYERFIQHIRCTENNESKNERIHGLKALGLLPIPHTLELVNTMKRCQEREQYWIEHYLYLGMPLTNEIRPALLRRAGKKDTPVILPFVEKLRDVQQVDAVKQMLSQGFNQGQIMLKVWGVKAGATEAYRAARAEYLQIVSEVQQS